MVYTEMLYQGDAGFSTSGYNGIGRPSCPCFLSGKKHARKLGQWMHLMHILKASLTSSLCQSPSLRCLGCPQKESKQVPLTPDFLNCEDFLCTYLLKAPPPPSFINSDFRGLSWCQHHLHNLRWAATILSWFSFNLQVERQSHAESGWSTGP